MSVEEKIDRILGESITDYNQFCEEARRVEFLPTTILFGKSGKLDSMGIVNLVVGVEDRIQSEFDRSLGLLEDPEFGLDANMQTVSQFKNFLAQKIEKNA